MPAGRTRQERGGSKGLAGCHPYRPRHRPSMAKEAVPGATAVPKVAVGLPAVGLPEVEAKRAEVKRAETSSRLSWL